MTFKTLGRFRWRGSLPFVEALGVTVAPIVAFLLRGVDLGAAQLSLPILTYCISSALGGCAARYYYRFSRSMSGFISSSDLIKIAKVSFTSAVVGSLGTYFGSYIHYLPRFVPIIHFSILFSLLTFLSVLRTRRNPFENSGVVSFGLR